jgi:hypothetical protein
MSVDGMPLEIANDKQINPPVYVCLPFGERGDTYMPRSRPPPLMIVFGMPN